MIFCLAVAHASNFDPPRQTFLIENQRIKPFFLSFYKVRTWSNYFYIFLFDSSFTNSLSSFIYQFRFIYDRAYDHIYWYDRLCYALYRYLKFSLKVWLKVSNLKSNFYRRSLDKYFQHCKNYYMIAIFKISACLRRWRCGCGNKVTSTCYQFVCFPLSKYLFSCW